MLVSAREISEQLRSKALSAEELMVETLANISATDPSVRAFLSIRDPDQLVAEAERIDRLRAEDPQAVGPMAGIPIAVKDNISVSGSPMTCGSRILGDYHPPYSATVVERLENAGIIVVGKTNMDEFGFGSSNENSAFFATRNPRALDRVPGGTSGGSAAAVASGMVPWSLGTDTGGSVRQPSSLCGVVGFRPSYGRVSRYGVAAYASSMDQVGPIATTVDDVGWLFHCIAGRDSLDATSTSEVSQIHTSPPTIGIPEEYSGDDCAPSVREALERTAEILKRHGWDVTKVSLPLTDKALSAYYIIASVEAAGNLSRYQGLTFGSRAPVGTSFADMATATRTEGFGDEAKRRIMLGTYASSAGYYDEYHGRAMRTRTLVAREFREALKQVDLLLCPVSPVVAWPLGERMQDPLSMYLADVFSVPVSLAGLPAISVPVGVDEDGLPIGMQLVGPRLADEFVLKAAGTLEGLVRADHA